MSKKAAEASLGAWPVQLVRTNFNTHDFDENIQAREVYIQGYEQAEKDIVSLIQSRLKEILGDAQPNPILRAELRELIKKIKEEGNE